MRFTALLALVCAAWGLLSVVLAPGAEAHSTDACWTIKGDTVTFYIASYHSLREFNGKADGSIVIGDKKHPFTKLIREDNIPKNAICSKCPKQVPKTTTYQVAEVKGFEDGDFKFTTSGSAISAPYGGCFPRMVEVVGSGPCEPDETPPAFKGLPLDQGGQPREEFAFCSKKGGKPPQMPKLKVFDNCDPEPLLTYRSNSPKNGVMERIWTATDSSENQRVYKQTLIDFCEVAEGLEGLSGDQGTQGVPGPLGNTGTPGINGNDGHPGIPGTPGVSGLSGMKGNPGFKGLPGKEGLKGPPGKGGPRGPKGVMGPDGTSGLQGPPGAPGPKGIQGESGEKGQLGFIGKPGDQGYHGKQGERGDVGDPGLTGLRGDHGPKGDTGDPGPNARFEDGRVTIETKIRPRVHALEESTARLEKILGLMNNAQRWGYITERPTASQMQYSLQQSQKDSATNTVAGLKEADNLKKIEDYSRPAAKGGNLGGLVGQGNGLSFQTPNGPNWGDAGFGSKGDDTSNPFQKFHDLKAILPVKVGQVKMVEGAKKEEDAHADCSCWPDPPPDCKCGPPTALWVYRENPNDFEAKPYQLPEKKE